MLTLGALSGALVVDVATPAGVAGATSSHAKTIKVSTAKVPNVGTVLTTASGLTLYLFTEDTPGTSKCTGACAKIWPPMLASKGAHVSGPRGVKGLSVMNVGNGHWQVAFHKIPLYRFAGDKKKGQALGQDVGKVWFAVLKSGIPATMAAAGAVAGAGPGHRRRPLRPPRQRHSPRWNRRRRRRPTRARGRTRPHPHRRRPRRHRHRAATTTSDDASYLTAHDHDHCPSTTGGGAAF